MERWRKLFDVGNYPIYLWTGPPSSFPSGTAYSGLPSAEDIYKAPNFTFFLSPAKVSGDLPMMEQFESDHIKEVTWFVSHVGAQYDSATAQILAAIPVPFPRPLEYAVEISDDIRGYEIRFRDVDMTLDDDVQAVSYAMDVGYSFLKISDALEGQESKYFRPYVVDDQAAKGSAFRQPSWQRAMLSGHAPSLFDQADVDTINQHRAATGRALIDLAAGWTPAEIADMAGNIRRHGREYNTGALKRRLSRY